MPVCELLQATDHIYWFTPDPETDRATIGLVAGDRYSVMLDGGASPAHTIDFLAALDASGLSMPRYVALTHWHWDHIFGLSALNTPVIAHHETAKHIQRLQKYDFSDKGLKQLIQRGLEVEFTREHMMKELTNEQRQQLKLVIPDFVFDGTFTIDMGDLTCQVIHVGGDHSADSCAMFVPEEKFMFLGDCLYYTVYELPRHYTRQRVIPLFETILSYDAETFVIGHGEEVMSRAEIQMWYDSIVEIYDYIDKVGTNDLDTLKADMSAEDFELVETIIAGLKW